MKTATTGQLLLERGACFPEALEKAARAAKAAGKRLCSQLLDSGVCDEQVLAAVLAEKHGIPGVDLSRTVVPLEVLARVPRPVAEGDLILPLSEEGGRLHIAMASPLESAKVVDEVRFVTGLEISPYIAVTSALKQAIAAAYEARDRGVSTWRGPAAAAGPGKLALVMPAKQSRDIPEIADEYLEPLYGEEEIELAAGADRAASGHGEADDEILEVIEESDGGSHRVLVVDDEAEIRLLLTRTLSAKGFTVEESGDGAEALARIAADPPDLVLLDAMLPRLHGFEVCRRVRSDPRTRHVPVILMTAVYRGWRFAQDARESFGAQDYIEKPFHIDDLLRRVAAVLESGSVGAPASPSAEKALRRGKELVAAGRAAEAAGALGEAVRLDPFSAEGHYELGRALRASGDHFGAMTALERAVELRGNFFPALRSLAALYKEKGFRRKASETLERALGAAPDPATRDAIKSDLMRLL